MTAHKMTPEEFLKLPKDGGGYELIGGELRERVKGMWASHVGGLLASRLWEHLGRGRDGWVFGSGFGHRCFPHSPDDIRRASVTYHRLDRLVIADWNAPACVTVAPDLVVDVRSPNDSAKGMDEARDEWLSAGVRLVWIVEPIQRMVEAFHTGGRVEIFDATDTLTAEPVVPGFAVPTADVFWMPGA